MKHCFFFLISFWFNLAVLADSPITSTNFYQAYLEDSIVRKAKNNGVIDREIADYLLSEEIGIDVKAAVCNALSWDIDGKNNAGVFADFISEKYNIPIDSLKLHKLSADELLCIGYLIILDDYFNPEKAVPILEMAREKKKNSYTINIIMALAKAQTFIENFEWCKVWEICREVKDNPDLEPDLLPEADEIIFEYIGIYKSECD